MSASQSSLRLFAAALCLAAPAAAQISFQPASTLPLFGLRPGGVAALDIDGDGDRDFAISSGQLQNVAGPEWVEVFLNNGAGGFTAGQVLQVGFNAGASALVAGDFDGDGDTDLAVSLKNINVVQPLTNTGGILSLGAAVSLTGVEPHEMAGGDVDGDGDMDLVTSNRSSNNLQLVLNNGGVFSAGALLPVGGRPTGVVVADLNGDGQRDLAVAAHDSRRVDVLLGTGSGAFGAVQSTPTPFNEKPSGMTAGDLDGDGDLDLATTLENNGVGYVVVLRNGGGASFTTTPFASSGLNPSSILAADLDVDGDLDLATADEDSNVVSALANNGAASFGPAALFATGAHPTAIAGADFDGNGSTDLVTPNRDSNNVSVLLNSAVGVTGPVVYCTAGVSVAGCQPSISATANPSVGHNTPCSITVAGVDGQRSGVVFYGLSALPQQWCGPGVGSSFLCVKAPTARIAQVSSGGVNGTCTGALTVDWNAYQLANPAALGAPWSGGSRAYVQGWYRDPQACKTTALSDALELTYQP